MRNKFILFVFISLLIIKLLTKEVSASEVELTVMPAQTQIILHNNNFFTKNFTIRNLKDPQVVILSVFEINPKDIAKDLSTLDFSNNNLKNVNVKNTNEKVPLNKPFLLNSNESIILPLEFLVTNTSQTDEIYLLITATTQNSNSFTDKNNLIINSSTSALITISNVKNLNTSINELTIAQLMPQNLKSFQILGHTLNFLNTSNDVLIFASVANKGRFSTQIRPNITLNNLSFNKIVESGYPVFTVFPQTQKQLNEKNLPIIRQNSFGLIDLKLSVTDFNSEVMARDHISFIAVPYSVFTALFLTPLFILILILFLKIKK